MLCQKCHQRQASVFISQTVGNETTHAHLCETCAQEQAQATGGMFPFGFNPFAAMSDIVNQFMSMGGMEIQEPQHPGRVPPQVEQQSQCPHCGYQLSTFRQNGRLGCTKCYESFASALAPLISSIHGNVLHVEETAAKQRTAPSAKKNPPQPSKSQNPGIEALREKLAEAIQNEKYEEAAKLRDEIHKIEKQ